MSTSLRKLAAFAVVLLMSLAISGAAIAQETPAEDEKIVFTVGLQGDMVSANPFKACCGSEYEMLFLAYDMLYNFDPETIVAADGLAVGPPEVSADGKTWTMKIREGVKWSDGEPLTAHDIAFTFNFIKDNEGMGTFNNYIGVPESFEAIDDTTFVWTMKTATPVGPNTPPWVPIIPQHIWEQFDGQDSKIIKGFRNVPAVGSGPFVLEEWKEGEFWRMSANKEYWGGTPTIDEVVFKLYGDQESLKLALQAGEIDFAEALTPNTFNQLKNDPNIETHVANEAYLDNLAFNFEGTANPALQDERVRDAIHHAINKQDIVDRVMLGNGTTGDSMILPMFAKWHRSFNGTADEVTYDPEEAKRLLDEAGFTDSDGDGVREQDGKPFSLEVLAISDVTLSPPQAELIVGFLKDIGIDAKMKVVSESKAYDLWGAQDFDMYVWGWGNDPDPDFTLSIFTKDQCLSWSDGCYFDPAYEKMYQEQANELDEDKRIALVNEMQAYLYDKAPEIVLVYEPDLQAWRKDKWEGMVYQPAPSGSVLFAWGPASYINLKPITAADGSTSSGESSGVPAWVWIAAVIAVIAIVGGIMARRGKSTENVE